MTENLPRIQTGRLVLRPAQSRDAPGFQDLLADPEGRRFTGGVVHKTVPEIALFLTNQAAGLSMDPKMIQSGQGHCRLAIEQAQGKEYIGYVGLAYCATLGAVELMYGLRRAWWRQGLGREAALALCNFAFEAIGLPAIQAAVNPQNPGSIRILEACAFRFERRIPWPGQGEVPVYALDRDAWLASRSQAGKTPGSDFTPPRAGPG